jgi:DNA-binding NtrC family response regulator
MGLDAGGDKEKKTILLVEDDEENRRILTEILTDMGQRVIDKPDVSSALLTVRSAARIDLVITDYCLPDSNGLDFVGAMREVLPSVPVIMMTAYGNAENYIKAMSLGVFEYINKPLDIREFERIIRTALRSTGQSRAVGAVL